MQFIGPTFYLSILAWLALMIFIYVKFDKVYTVSFYEKYLRRPPSEYLPEEMSLLIHYEKTHPRDLVAALLNLVRRDYLVIKKENDEFILEYGSKKEYGLLSSHEVYLIDWFMKRTGRVSLSGLAEISMNYKRMIEFTQSYGGWRKALKMDAVCYNFFDNRMPAKVLGGVAGLLFIITSVFCMHYFNMIRFVLTAVLGALIIAYSGFVQKRSLKGQEQYEKWMAFKRFLKDFPVIGREEASSIAVWEEYLVYAISLGVVKEVLDKLPEFFEPEEWESPELRILNTAYNKEHGLEAFEEMLAVVIKAIENALLISGRL